MNKQDKLVKRINTLRLAKQVVQTSFRFMSTQEEIDNHCNFIDEWIEELEKELKEGSDV